jgi:hypothetical protein
MRHVRPEPLRKDWPSARSENLKNRRHLFRRNRNKMKLRNAAKRGAGGSPGGE